MTESKNIFGSSLPEPPKLSGLATASFVCATGSWLSLPLAHLNPVFGTGFLLCIPAVLLAHAARRVIKRNVETYRNGDLATYGMWLGYAGLVFNIVVAIMVYLNIPGVQ